jgi:hypothetical protein
MIIDTKDDASTWRRTKAFVMIIYVGLIVIPLLYVDVPAVYKAIFFIVLSIFFLLFQWFQYKMDYTYFYFSDNRKDLVFKFYSLRFFSENPKIIEIPKKSFCNHDIVTNFFGKKDSIVLYQRTNKGIVKYPPISLALLSKNTKTKLKQTLFIYIDENSKAQ